jgi:RNA polymerase sigma-70 factor (ECF subfamily)
MARGDDADIATLFRRHGPAVHRRALRILGNEADAEEATQEVFTRALRGADGFRGASQRTTWLYQITTNYCLNRLRDGKRQRALLAEPSPHGETSSAPLEDIALLRALLVRVPPDQARAAVYVHLDGMSHEEAAALLGVSRRTVGNLLERLSAWVQEQTTSLPPEREGTP